MQLRYLSSLINSHSFRHFHEMGTKYGVTDPDLRATFRDSRISKAARAIYRQRKRAMCHAKKKLATETLKLDQLLQARRIVVNKVKPESAVAVTVMETEIARAKSQLQRLSRELLPRLPEDDRTRSCRKKMAALSAQIEDALSMAVVGQVNERLTRLKTRLMMVKKELREYQQYRLLDDANFRELQASLKEKQYRHACLERKRLESRYELAERDSTDSTISGKSFAPDKVQRQKKHVEIALYEYSAALKDYQRIRTKILGASIKPVSAITTTPVNDPLAPLSVY